MEKIVMVKSYPGISEKYWDYVIVKTEQQKAEFLNDGYEISQNLKPEQVLV